MKKLAIVTTHPIQYYAPVFKILTERGNIAIKVFYTWGEAAGNKFDPGFGKTVDWDIPLLDGYEYEWADNTSPQPGSHHGKGIITPYLKNQIKAFQPDALLVIGWAYHSHLSIIRYFKGKLPVYFRGDSTLLDEKPGFRNLLKYVFLRWVYNHIDHVFYPGTNSRAYFKKFGISDRQITFAPHAVDNERFAEPQNDAAKNVRNRLGISVDDCVILFAGKLEEKKDPLLLLQAFKAFAPSHCHLVFVGNGGLETTLKNATAKAGNIHFINFVNQSAMPAIYQAADLFCLPSKGPGETWGLAVNEAMACGKAVLISDKVGCGTDLVRPGHNGNIFKAGDLNDLVQKLQDLVSSKDKLRTYGLNSASIIKDWNFTRIAEAIECVLLKTSLLKR